MTNSINFRNRQERLLAALRYFMAEDGELRPMDDGPKGLGWSTIHILEKAGLIELAGTATSIRKTPFRTTSAGRQILNAADPSVQLSKYEQREMAQPAPNNRAPVVRAPRAETSRSTPARKERSFLPRGLSRSDAAWYIGVGVSKFDEMVRDGRMPAPKRIDSRRVWDRVALDDAFDELPSTEERSTRREIIL